MEEGHSSSLTQQNLRLPSLDFPNTAYCVFQNLFWCISVKCGAVPSMSSSLEQPNLYLFTINTVNRGSLEMSQLFWVSVVMKVCVCLRGCVGETEVRSWLQRPNGFSAWCCRVYLFFFDLFWVHLHTFSILNKTEDQRDDNSRIIVGNDLRHVQAIETAHKNNLSERQLKIQPPVNCWSWLCCNLWMLTDKEGIYEYKCLLMLLFAHEALLICFNILQRSEMDSNNILWKILIKQNHIRFFLTITLKLLMQPVVYEHLKTLRTSYVNLLQRFQWMGRRKWKNNHE